VGGDEGCSNNDGGGWGGGEGCSNKAHAAERILLELFFRNRQQTLSATRPLRVAPGHGAVYVAEDVLGDVHEAQSQLHSFVRFQRHTTKEANSLSRLPQLPECSPNSVFLIGVLKVGDGWVIEIERRGETRGRFVVWLRTLRRVK
jgi:hypothetical protein